jgi:hypothetical protein
MLSRIPCELHLAHFLSSDHIINHQNEYFFRIPYWRLAVIYFILGVGVDF